MSFGHSIPLISQHLHTGVMIFPRFNYFYGNIMNEINYKLLQQVHQLKPIIHSSVMAAGSYLPKQRVTSQDIMRDIDTEKHYGLPYDWMSTEMGINERCMVADNESPSKLAIAAAEDVLAQCPQLNFDDIGAVIFCGIERDLPEPATAHVIQRALGLKAAYVFDLANACFGFFQGVKLASSLIESSSVSHALVVTGEVSTKVARAVIRQLKRGLSPEEAKHLWGILSVGDAGGAMLLGPAPDGQSGFRKFNQRSESQYSNLCHYRWKADGEVAAHMNMSHIVARGLKLNKRVYRETFEELEWDSVDWVIAHQTGRTAFEHVRDIHGVTDRQFIKTYPLLGNITTATLPVSFKKLVSSGSLKTGDRIGGLFAGSGLVGGQFGYIVGPDN